MHHIIGMAYRPSTNLTGLGHWLTAAGGQAPDPVDVADGLFRRLVGLGVPLMRGNIAMTTLHPEIVGFSYRWTSDSDETILFFRGVGGARARA